MFSADNVPLFIAWVGPLPKLVPLPPARLTPTLEGTVLSQVSEHLSKLSWDLKSKEFPQNKVTTVRNRDGGREGNVGLYVPWRHRFLQEGRETGSSTALCSVSGDCSITGGPACVRRLPGQFKNSFCSQGRGQGGNEDKWPFARKLSAMNLPRLELEWKGLLP